MKRSVIFLVVFFQGPLPEEVSNAPAFGCCMVDSNKNKQIYK
jgi:hypothetical protein